MDVKLFLVAITELVGIRNWVPTKNYFAQVEFQRKTMYPYNELKSYLLEFLKGTVGIGDPQCREGAVGYMITPCGYDEPYCVTERSAAYTNRGKQEHRIQRYCSATKVVPEANQPGKKYFTLYLSYVI